MTVKTVRMKIVKWLLENGMTGDECEIGSKCGFKSSTHIWIGVPCQHCEWE